MARNMETVIHLRFDSLTSGITMWIILFIIFGNIHSLSESWPGIIRKWIWIEIEY